MSSTLIKKRLLDDTLIGQNEIQDELESKYIKPNTIPPKLVAVDGRLSKRAYVSSDAYISSEHPDIKSGMFKILRPPVMKNKRPTYLIQYAHGGKPFEMHGSVFNTGINPSSLKEVVITPSWTCVNGRITKYVGNINQHPEILNNTFSYEFVRRDKSSTRILRFIPDDNSFEPFEMQEGNFKLGNRPLKLREPEWEITDDGRVVNYKGHIDKHPEIVDKTFTYERGTSKILKFTPLDDAFETFYAAENNFKAGARPWKLRKPTWEVDEAGRIINYKGNLDKHPQIENKQFTYQFIRRECRHRIIKVFSTDGLYEPFEVYEGNFKAGHRPVCKIGENKNFGPDASFQFIDAEDANLGHMSSAEIFILHKPTTQIIKTRPAYITRGICIICGATHISQYSKTECLTCWASKNTKLALALGGKRFNKSELICSIILKEFPHIFGDIRLEYKNFLNQNTGHWMREDFVFIKWMIALALDGLQHFQFVGIFNNDPHQIRATDVEKTIKWLHQYPDMPYIRILQTYAYKGYPVNMDKPITFDYISVCAHIIQNRGDYKNTVIFVEPKECTLYDNHKIDYTLQHIKWTSIDPSNFKCTKLDDKRTCFLTVSM